MQKNEKHKILRFGMEFFFKKNKGGKLDRKMLIFETEWWLYLIVVVLPVLMNREDKRL